jgi:hypothetical protein
MCYHILLKIEICCSQNEWHLTLAMGNMFVFGKAFVDNTAHLPSDFRRYTEVILQAAVL